MDRRVLVLVILVGMVFLITIALISFQTGFIGFAVKDSEGGLKILGKAIISIDETEIPKTSTTEKEDYDSTIRRLTPRSSGGGGGGTSGGGGSSSSGGSTGSEEADERSEIIKTAKLSVDSYSGNENKFSINVNIDIEEEIYALEFDLIFNPAVIEAEKLEEGNFLSKDGASTYPIIKINNTEGKIKFASTRFGTQEGVSGTGVIAKIEFNVLNKGVSQLNLGNVKIVNPQLQEIYVSLTNSKVNVS